MSKRIGNYLLLKEIGKGGFGTVYEAQNDSGEKFAIKCIQIQTKNVKANQRIEEEIQCMQKFESQFIVRLYEVLKTRRNLYLIMELVKGGDIQELLDQQVPVPEEIAKRLISQLIEALKLLHENKVIHRDLKPANILLTNRDPALADVKVMDFGLSRNIMNASMMVQSFVGSPVFMAPEVLNSSSYSFKADVWSLGALCYEIMCGRQAFEATSLDDLKVVQNRRLKFSASCRISVAAKEFLQNMLIYEARDRPTIAELQLHPFLYNASLADMSPPKPVVDFEIPVLDNLAPSQSSVAEVLRLEQQVVEANFIMRLAEDYRTNSNLLIALLLYRLFKDQQISNLNEAEAIKVKYNVHQNELPSFDNLYDSIQTDLVVSESTVDSLDEQVQLGSPEAVQAAVKDQMIDEAFRLISLSGDQLEHCKKAFVIVGALLQIYPNDEDAVELIGDVSERYYMLSQGSQ